MNYGDEVIIKIINSESYVLMNEYTHGPIKEYVLLVEKEIIQINARVLILMNESLYIYMLHNKNNNNNKNNNKEN